MANRICLLLTGIRDAPNAARAIVRDKEQSVAAYGDTHRIARKQQAAQGVYLKAIVNMPGRKKGKKGGI
jgi:hypothetical protein